MGKKIINNREASKHYLMNQLMKWEKEEEERIGWWSEEKTEGKWIRKKRERQNYSKHDLTEEQIKY